MSTAAKRCYIAAYEERRQEMFDHCIVVGDIVGFSVNINTGIITFVRNGKEQGTPFKIPWPSDSLGRPYRVSVSLATDNKVTLLH
jgi:hypothetical protein